MNSCTCEKCVEACKEQPGWFLPGEAEKVAEFLGIPFKKFADEYLIKDSASNWDVGNAPYVYAPKKFFHPRGPETEKIRGYLNQRADGICVFLENDRCKIHEVKPFECREVFVCRTNDPLRRDKIETNWIEAGAPLGMRPDPG